MVPAAPAVSMLAAASAMAIVAPSVAASAVPAPDGIMPADITALERKDQQGRDDYPQ